jgi:hypothetical protein
MVHPSTLTIQVGDVMVTDQEILMEYSVEPVMTLSLWVGNIDDAGFLLADNVECGKRGLQWAESGGMHEYIMKTAILFVALCLFGNTGICSDQADTSKKEVADLIASIPTVSEMAFWKATSEDYKKAWSKTELPLRIMAREKNCKRLESLITPGKSVFDYPGLLSIGRIMWHSKTETYSIVVDIKEGLTGFSCEFDKSMIILNKKHWTQEDF